jgi:hypothetical protein
VSEREGGGGYEEGDQGDPFPHKKGNQCFSREALQAFTVYFQCKKIPYNGGRQQRAAGEKSANHVLLMLSPLLTTCFSQCCEFNAGNTYGENGISLFIFINRAHFFDVQD